MKSLDFSSETRRTPELPRRASVYEASRLHRLDHTPLPAYVIDMDYAEVELRILARAVQRREARMGYEGPFDIFDFDPRDFA